MKSGCRRSVLPGCRALQPAEARLAIKKGTQPNARKAGGASLADGKERVDLISHHERRFSTIHSILTVARAIDGDCGFGE